MLVDLIAHGLSFKFNTNTDFDAVVERGAAREVDFAVRTDTVIAGAVNGLIRTIVLVHETAEDTIVTAETERNTVSSAGALRRQETNGDERRGSDKCLFH